MQEIEGLAVRDLWEMDKEKTFARYEITPIRENGEFAGYRIHDTLEIRPYPNPFSFGGCYGSSFVKNDEDLAMAIASFEDGWVGEWERRGMRPMEIVWQPEYEYRIDRTLPPPAPAATGAMRLF